MKNNKENKGSTIWIVMFFVIVLILSIVITEILATESGKIKMTEYVNELSTENESLILLSIDECTECNQINRTLQEIETKNGINTYELNVDDLSDSDLNVLFSSSDLIDIDTLPTVLHMSAGAVIGSYTDDLEYNDLLEYISVYKKITVKEYLELVKEDEEKFIYIGRPTCGYCIKSEPLTKRISYELDKNIYYINIDEESDSDLELLETETDGIYRGSTPLFLITKAGAIVDYKEGAGTYDNLNSFFKGENNQ
ncbi:MAG: hypothetical protein PHT75_03870 [Bacilli bacterium]|nr:hypothetical protein [Bacilli bacterium]MDD3305229.1 hypothetical protein [Bacilli bacterium]